MHIKLHNYDYLVLKNNSFCQFIIFKLLIFFFFYKKYNLELVQFCQLSQQINV